MGEVINIKKARSAIDVIFDSTRRRKRGRNSSFSYCGVDNPKWALLYAIYSNKFGTESEGNGLKELCFALFDEEKETEVPYYALTEDPINYPKILERLLNQEDFVDRRHSFVAILCQTNSLVVAEGDEEDFVIKEAKRRGVKNPVVINIGIEQQISFNF